MNFKIVTLIVIAGFATTSLGHSMGKSRSHKKKANAEIARLKKENEKLVEEQKRLKKKIAKDNEERRRITEQHEEIEKQRLTSLALVNAWNESKGNSNADSAESFKWNRSRCQAEGDDLPNDTALTGGRFAWVRKCLGERIAYFGEKEKHAKQAQDGMEVVYRSEGVRFRSQLSLLNIFENAKVDGRYFYPLVGKIVFTEEVQDEKIVPQFSIENTYDNGGTEARYVAPTSESAACDWPEGFGLAAMCVGGCYTPEQIVLFSDGYKEIGSVIGGPGLELVTVHRESTSDSLKFTITPLEAMIASLQEGWNSIVEIQTLSGKMLRVTANHPMLTAKGVMVRADHLGESDLLVNEQGEPEAILAIAAGNYYGKVYNVQPATGDLLENIVVSNGLLTGSNYYQNEGVQNLNRQLLRLNVPSL
ncbi:MAG TPA: hypothetical protein PLH57_10655 [Oligoflexia bacterium]|nr:hypothetical protein [Oligoflexia bacterium]